MCKTYDAIFEVRKHVESSYLIVWIDNKRIKGELHYCDDKECKLLKEVITLKDVTIFCEKTGNEHHLRWINIPSSWIRAFAFECCMIN